jgi:predicted nucleotidyltransferase
MEMATLTASTGHARVDAALQGVIGLLQIVFPGRIRACYVTGSYADGTAVDTSDVDLLVVFKGGASESEFETVFDVADNLRLLSPVFLDLLGASEEQWLRSGHRLDQSNSLFVFGDDVRFRMPAAPPGDVMQDAVRSTYRFIAHVARRTEDVTYPVDFPNPTAEFYGYEDDPVEGGKDTKLLMAIVGCGR